MIPFAITATLATSDPAALIGSIITHAVRLPNGDRLRKGQMIAAADLSSLATLDREIHAVRLEPDDVHEDNAGVQLAAMIAGPGLTARAPVQSRVTVVAARKGLLRVDAEAIHAMNRLAPIGVFTVLDRLPVVPGKIVAGAKIATVAIERDVLEAAMAIVDARPGPVLEVKPYRPHRVGVVVTEGLAEGLRARFESAVRAKMTWYGSTVERFAYLANDPGVVSREIETMLREGIMLILAAGGNMMDPLDAAMVALPRIGARFVRIGAPAHPGSMFWLAEIPDQHVAIVNLASCSMYSRTTVADLVLPWVMAGEPAGAEDLAAIGYGGLLDRDMGWRFPTYDIDTVDEPDEH